MILEFGETQHTSHETECNAEMHCGGVAVVETEYYKGDIPQASSCGLFSSSEAGKRLPWRLPQFSSSGLCLLFSNSIKLAKVLRFLSFQFEKCN